VGRKDFYTGLEEQWREDAMFTAGYSLLVFIATVIATARLLADNSANFILLSPFHRLLDSSYVHLARNISEA